MTTSARRAGLLGTDVGTFVAPTTPAGSDGPAEVGFAAVEVGVAVDFDVLVDEPLLPVQLARASAVVTARPAASAAGLVSDVDVPQVMRGCGGG